MIEDEIVHWWKDEKGQKHRTILRIERRDSTEQNGFPRDGLVTLNHKHNRANRNKTLSRRGTKSLNPTLSSLKRASKSKKKTLAVS